MQPDIRKTVMALPLRLFVGAVCLVAVGIPITSSAADHKRDKTMNKTAKEMTRALNVVSSGIREVKWDGNNFVFYLEYQPEYSGFEGSGDEGYNFILQAYIDPMLNDLRQSEMASLLVSLNAGMKIMVPLVAGENAESYEYHFSAEDLRKL